MSYMDEYNKLKKKRQEETKTSAKVTNSGGSSYLNEYNKLRMDRTGETSLNNVLRRPTVSSKSDKEKEAEKEERKWFDTSVFDDGFQWSDIPKAVVGTGTDISKNLWSGILGIGEKVVDAGITVGTAMNHGSMMQAAQSEMMLGALSGKDTDGKAILSRYQQAQDEAEKATSKFVAKDLYDEEKIARKIISDPVKMITGIDSEKDSLLGAKSDSLVQSGGQLIAQLGTNALLPGSGMALMATTAFGSEAEGAFKNGATFDEAVLSSTITAGAEILTERLGGISFGGKTLTDAAFEGLSRKMTSKIAKALITSGKVAADMTAEGAEEILSGYISAIGQKMTYMDDKEIKEIFSSEDMLESFIGGAVLGGAGSVGSVIQAKSKGVDYVTGLTKNEEAVVQKVYEEKLAEKEKSGKVSSREKNKIYNDVVKQMERGYIDTETIESVLGGDNYKTYKDTIDNEKSLIEQEKALTKEYNDLSKKVMTGEEMDRREELKTILPELRAKIKANEDSGNSNQLKSELSKYVSDMVHNDRLAESYNEKARASEDFKADFEKYKGTAHEDAAKKTLENASKAGANNTNRVHDLVDMMANLSSKTGKVVDFKSGEDIKNDFIALQTEKIAKFESIENRTAEQNEHLKKLKDQLAKVQRGELVVNGNITGDTIVLNLDSSKPLNRITGHEVTHPLKQTQSYDKLRDVVFNLAKTKGVDIDAKIEELKLKYDGIEDADPEAELVADLVGDYLFTDLDFINNLSTEHRNIAQKIYDEIKHLLKMATAGSKEARELERVKKAFEDSFRESAQAQKNTADSGAKYAFESKKQPGRLDPRTVTKADVVDMLHKVEEGTIYGDTYIPVRIGTPEKLIYWAEKRRGDIIDNNPIAISADKAYNAMNRAGETENGRPNKLSTDEIVSMVESMNDPQYIVYQNSNDRYVEVVKFNTITGDKAFAVIEIGNNKDAVYMNGYEGGLYNILVTTYPPKSGKLKELLTASSNEIIYDKSKDASQRTSSSTVPSVLNDASFYEDTLPDNGKEVKTEFSLSNSVEQTKDLVALHNLTADKLTKSLELGGLPMPSLAITKADIPHSNFGDITLVFGKETIDPKANKKNKVYSADAWTPVFPRTEYEANSEVEKKISQKVRDLSGKVDDYFQRDLNRVSYDFEDYLNRYDGEEGLIQNVMDNYGLKAAYLEEHGKHVEKVTMQKEAEKGFNPDSADKYQKIMDILGVTTADEINKVNLKEARDNHGAELEAVYPGITATAMRMGRLFNVVKSYIENKNSGPVYQTVTDGAATEKAVDNALDTEGYEAWVRNLFSGIEKDKGIYNNKDIFTPSGNRRSFKQTHLPVTLENIVKAMASQNGGKTKNVSGFNGVKTLRAATAETFKSVDEMHQRKDRLQNLTDEQLEAITDDLQTRLYSVIETIDNESGQTGGSNSLFRFDSIGETLTEIGESGKFGVADIQNVFKQYSRNISDDTALEVKQLLYDVSQMPVNIFEAKPERVVSFDEAKVFVIPNNTDAKLKQELLNRGYSIAEYDPNIEGHRQQVVNQFEDYKFSISQQTEDFAPIGSFDFYGKDFRNKSADTAPVAETNTETVEPDIAPTTISETETVEDYAPGESLEEQLAKADDAIESLDTETEALFRDLSEQKITEAEFAEKWHDLDKRYTQARQEQERLSAEMTDINNRKYESLDDSDIPPEAEAPYPGEPNPIAPADPFAERDMNDVGKRNVKAYMYENPDVAPYFQEAAMGMLYDLHNGTRGERLFNEQVHYETGYEKGWMGTKRHTTDDIAALLDQWKYSYDQIEAGLNAIIEGNGKENNAVSKRIEFMLDYRLRNGYRDVLGQPIPKNEEYINLLNEKQIDAYRSESLDSFMEVADQHAPPVEDVAPVEDIAPLKDEPAIEGEQDTLNEFEQPEQEKAPERLTRAKLHSQIVDGIKAEFAKKGLDFDEVLKDAHRMNALSINDNTPQRVNDKTFGYEAGEALNELTFNRVALRESNGVKWLNKQVDTIRNLSKKYKIKPLSKESAAAQMYAEGFWVNEKDEIIAYGDAELAQDFPDVKVQNRIKALARDPVVRKIYDDTLSAINESRKRNAYPEIPRLENYYLHFRAMDDTFSRLGVPFNPNDIKAKDLPTDINGTTIDRKPGQPFFASSMHREGKRTSFDLFGGLEKYLNSAKNQIYHIDDIQTARALWGYIADRYGQAHGLENLDHMELEAQQEHIQQVYDGHLSNYARFLVEYANHLAGKTALIDRGVEGLIGRRALQFINTVNMQTSRNQVGYSISSPLTNFIPSMEAIARTSKRDSIKAFAQTVSNVFRKDGFVESDPTLTRRKGTDKFAKTLWDKMSDPGFILMGAVDNVTSEFIVRTKYNELTRKGMDSRQAHVKAGEWASRIMGDRSLGQMPLHYNSKFMGLFTKYQLEVRNALDSQFYDTYQEAKTNTKEVENQKAKNALTATKFAYRAVQIAALNHLFGMAFEKIAGYNPAFDIVSTIIKLFGLDDDEEDEDTFVDNAEQAFKELLGDLPYTSLFTDGGRIPIGSAMPIKQLISGVDKYGNEKARWETALEAAPYYLLPGGYGQIKKTTQGLGMFSEEHPVSGSYTDSGGLRFPVEKTFGNVVQAAVFGQYASENARDYFDNERKPLKEKQIQEYIDVDIPIKDYWEYREGLAKLKTNEEKVDYIDSLDLPLSKKNILVNNVLDRKEDVDLADYGEYGSLAEFDFAVKYPEKYQFLEENGVTYEAYSTADDDTKDAYNWAFQNPDKYTVSKAIAGDVVEYRSYTKDIDKIEADKDENGKSISGSRKEKVFAYIDSLPLDYGQKCILFKSQYKAEDSINMDIIEYLDSREDISYEEMVTILTELDFTVNGNNVYWD